MAITTSTSAVTAIVALMVMMIAACLASLELASAHDINPGQYKKKSNSSDMPPGQYQKKQQEPSKPTTDYKLYPAKKPIKKPTVALAVEGVVLCQNCNHVGSRSLKDAKPLAGAKVQLACRDWQYKTFLYQTATTDAHGYFFIRVPNFEFVKHKPLKACKVFLVSSPSKDCNTRTDIGFGKQGAMLRRLKDYPARQALYSAGPFAFAPAPCKAPPLAYTSPPPVYRSPPPVYRSPPPYKSPPAHHPPPPYKAHN